MRARTLTLVLLGSLLAGCGGGEPAPRADLTQEDLELKRKIQQLMQAYHQAGLAERGPLRDQVLALGGPGEAAIYAYLTAIFRSKGRAQATSRGVRYNSPGVTNELLIWARDEFVAVMRRTEHRGMIVLLANLKTEDEVARDWSIQVLEPCREGKVKVAEEGRPVEWVVAHELVGRVYQAMRKEQALPGYRIALLQAIAAMKAERGELGLRAFYDELAGSDWKLRGRLVQAVALFDEEEAGELIELARKDSDPAVRMLATRADRKRTRRLRRKESGSEKSPK